jgi:hypothetical protein
MYVSSGAAFEAVAETGETGLVGTIELRIDDNDGVTVVAASAANIIELGSTGVYSAERTAPVTASLQQYTLIWSLDGSFDPETVITEDLLVGAATAEALPPIDPPAGGGVGVGPCSSWITGDDVAACHTEIGTDTSLLDSAAESAVQLLFEKSGRQFSGLCERTVRPCGQSSCFPTPQILEGGYVVWPYSWNGQAWWGDEGRWCGCTPLSKVRLPGYPVRAVSQVVIDGDVVDPSEYRLDGNQWLLRLRDADGERTYWPSCQNLDDPTTEAGTWAVTYTYGQEAPQAGADAAAELAWQIYLACPGVSGGTCKLPTGSTRVTRTGVTIEMKAFTAWAFGREGWKTGLPLVDLFLNTYNPHGIRRRGAIISPDVKPYAYETG